MTAYYNENDEFAAQWLRNLIKKGLISDGEVDTRSIIDVRADDLGGFSQHHFFAGIGVWSYALRCAGWPDDRPIWTGSCPCGPFSQAGLQRGFDDERHLWPEFFRLIAEFGPCVIVGEQVASPHGLAWVDLVQADMEGKNYAFAAVDLCAAGIGAPHIRQRIYWVADATRKLRHRRGRGGARRRAQHPDDSAAGVLVDGERARLEGYTGHGDGAAGWSIQDRPITATGAARELADADGYARGSHAGAIPGRSVARLQHAQGENVGWPLKPDRDSADSGATGVVADADGGDASAEGLQRSGQQRLLAQDRRSGPERRSWPGPINGIWRDADWLLCRDGKWRPVEPGTFPLAHGVANRVGLLRGYGNALVAPVAQAFIEAVMEVMPC